MPIGKNALKRVENNGYSKVATSAPDMENSVVAESAELMKSAKTVTKPAAKKTVKSVPAPKKTAEKVATAKKVAVEEMPTKAEKKKEVTPKKPRAKKMVTQPKAVSLGSELPYYLL